MEQAIPTGASTLPLERGMSISATRAGKKRVAPPDWPTLPSSVVKSAGRALQILEYFDDTRDAANLVDVSRALGYPESSTSILLRSLATLGYLDYDRYGRTYRPTSRVRLLGDWIDPKLFEGDAIIRLMERIHAETSGTVVLATRNGLHAQYIYVVQAQSDPIPHLTRGVLRPIAQSAPGYVLLNRVNDIELAKLVRRINADARHFDDVLKVSEVLDHVATVRRDGHIFVRSRIFPGISVLAMPVPAGLASTPLALAVGGPSGQMDGRTPELVDLLRRCMDDALQG